MTTYPTLHEAREGARDIFKAKSIAEIDHMDHGRCFVLLVSTFRPFEAAQEHNPSADIKRVFRGHTIENDEELKIEREASLKENTKCERCRKQIDGNVAYSQDEWTRLGNQKIQVTAFYCSECRSVLSSIGAGERTELEERAGDIPSYEPRGKEDF